MTQDELYMKKALKLASKCLKGKDVPVGCIIVKNNKIIGAGFNKRNRKNNALLHAEIIAINKACKKVHDWVLEDATMYVTLEPCQMCAGAIVQSRLTKVVMGCMNPKAGRAGSVLNLLNVAEFNHQVELETGVLEEECSGMMKRFFKMRREQKKAEKILLEKEKIGREEFEALFA